jgi:PAS domain S-box-containing protein
MKANAAICFLLAGITLILVNLEKKKAITKRAAAFFSIIIFITGAVTVLEYIFGFNASIDEFFFKDEAGIVGKIPPGRQSPFSAAYFMLFGFCYLPGIYGKIKIYLFQILHIISGIFVLAAALSYFLGSYVIAGISLNFIFVFHSTFSFLFLIMAVLFSQPEKGYMKLVSSNTIGGKIIRKTLPVFLFVFVVIGWLGLRGEQIGLFNTEFSFSLLVILMIIIFGIILISGAASLSNWEVILKQSEEKLLLSNKTLDAAEKMAKLGSWEYNMDGQEGIWSKQIFRLLDLPIADKAPSFKEFLRIVHPDDRKPAQDIFDQMVDGIEIETKIFRTNPEKGDIKYLLLDWHVIKDTNGRPLKYFGTLQCVSERVRAKKKLKESEELFKKAFHSKAFGLAIVNQERRVVDINETLANLLEYKREDFIGKTAVEIGLTSPAYIKKRDELLLVILQKGGIENYELQLETRHGKHIDLLLSVEPMNLNDKSHWLIYLVDVTEKKKAEKELAESEKKLRTILQTEPECVKLIDINGDLTYMNPAGLAMMEADTFDMVSGKKSYNIINEPYRDAFIRLAINVFKGQPGKFEYEITGLKGTQRWLETHVVPLRNADEKIISLLGVTRDITESKKAAEQIKKYNEELRQLTAHLQSIREEERKRIGREIHDELGQQLTVLKMHASRLRRKNKKDGKDEEDIAGILNQADHCIQMVRKISTELRPSIIDDFGIVAALEWQADEFERRTKIKTSFQANVKELNLPPDHTNTLFRIFQESLTNVVRHSEANNVHSSLLLQHESVILTISDDGKGFDTGVLKTTKTLGFLGMKERINLINGSFEITSTAGKGTEIRVLFPLPEEKI